MKILTAILVLALSLLPVNPAMIDSGDWGMSTAWAKEKGRKDPSSGKVVIKGKGGKVTGVVQPPPKKSDKGRKK